MAHRTETWGGLTCRIVDRLEEGQAPEFVVIICHGFGAPGTDLVPIGDELFQLSPAIADKVRFLFPEAPLSLDQFGMYGGRAWWYLDVNELVAAVERGETRVLRNDLPDGLPEAREMFLSMLKEVQQQTSLPTSKFILGGFSQGSMLATDVTLHLPEAPAALCIWSGTLLCENIWKELAPHRSGLPVLQSHGRQDPILPFEAAESLRDMLRESSLDVDFIGFNGMHTIPMEALQSFASLLERISSE